MTDSASNPDTTHRGRAALETIVTLAMVQVIVSAVTTLSYIKLRSIGDEQRAISAHEAAVAVDASVEDSFDSYIQVLHTMRALLRSSEIVYADEWNAFVEAARLEHTHPGVWGFGYVSKIEADEAPSLVREMHESGFTDFAIHDHPSGSRVDPDEPLYVIKFHVPEERNRSAWGLNVASLPVNRAVYDESARVNEVRCSIPFRLKQRRKDDNLGVVLSLPHFAPGMPTDTPEQRMDAVVGWAMMPIDFEHFFAAESIPAWEDASLTLLIPDPEGDRAVIFGARRDSMIDPVNHEFQMMVGGRAFELQVWIDHAQHASVFDGYATMVLVGGACSGVALGVIVWLVARSRDHARRLAHRMTQRLRSSEAEQRELASRAEEASRAKSMFLANMSHEIRTPMTAILGFTDVIADHIGDGEEHADIRQATSRIQAAGTHLLKVINDVLDISKIESGKIEYHAEPMSPHELAEEVVSTLEGNAKRALNTLECEISPTVPPSVLCDSDRVRQILINLVGNALKFTDRGSVVVRVAWDLGMLHISVHDTGVGIEPEKLESIFGAFTQADETHVRRHQGTGLGLAISESLARGMGGTLTATSVPGDGSTFRLVVPAPEAAEKTERLPVPAVPAAASPTVGRVLVADDCEDNRRLIEIFLEREGIDVSLVSNGQEAYDAAMAGQYDLIVMDMQMPVLDGYDAVRKLRASGYNGMIMALTAHALASDRAACLAAGCDLYQAKPLNRDAFTADLAACLGRARAA